MRLMQRYVAAIALVSILAVVLLFVATSHLLADGNYNDNVLVPRPNIIKNYFRQLSNLTSWNSGKIIRNELIDNYGKNDPMAVGEVGRGVLISADEDKRVKRSMGMYRINIYASEMIPLNRMVPDSRPPSCANLKYDHNLPTTSIVVPFYNEWPSVLLRTVYSIINRTPAHILKEIILVDDASVLQELQADLDSYIQQKFPPTLVKLIRLKERVGLIKARLEGFKHVTGEVVSFFDSHMEVNINWLQPLLTELVKNRKTVAMGHLDYIDAKTFKYGFSPGYKTRYGFDWRLIFFETYFRDDQLNNKTETEALPGVVMVGPAFVVDVNYFKEIGLYDDGMKIWGGENLEFAWRVWMCGGRLIHLPCSKIGHIARPQPYRFPDGRFETEMHNYKRAIDVWMGDHRRFVYDFYPNLKDLDAGDISERLAIKKALNCKDFGWFMKNVWPELNVYDEDVKAWGMIKNNQTGLCFDNHEYLFQSPEQFSLLPCTQKLFSQGFSLTNQNRLKTSLQCVKVIEINMELRPVLENCMDGKVNEWRHESNKWLRHEESGLCLDTGGRDKTHLLMGKCDKSKISQRWIFQHYVNLLK